MNLDVAKDRVLELFGGYHSYMSIQYVRPSELPGNTRRVLINYSTPRDADKVVKDLKGFRNEGIIKVERIE